MSKKHREHKNPKDEGSQEQELDEPRPDADGTYYGELSSGAQWFWRGTGASDDQWVPNPAVITEEPLAPEQQDVVMPMAASAAFYITVAMVYPGGATQIGQATTYQVITPWGQSTACISLDDALNQMVASGSQYSGQMGNYLNNGVTRGLATGGGTVPTSASYFQALP